jgi:YfiR/HmsC-like
MKTRRRIVALAVLWSVMGWWSQAALAQDNLRLAEQEIKAGLIYNFLKYTDFPSDDRDQGPLRVCLLGKNPLGGRLAAMGDRTVNQRSIAVIGLGPAGDLSLCALVFVAADAKPMWPMLSAVLAKKDVLTIGDFNGFADAGGMIEFFKANDRIEIRINSPAIGATKLSLDNRILRLASVR